MLVLSRKKDESIVLDGQIEITVLKIKGNTVRLGIKAPANIKVLRGELSPFDVEVEMQKDASENEQESEPIRRSFGLTSHMEAVAQDVALPNPFAITAPSAS